MTELHPVDATHIIDLGIEFLVDFELAGLLAPPGTLLHDTWLAERLEGLDSLGRLATRLSGETMRAVLAENLPAPEVRKSCEGLFRASDGRVPLEPAFDQFEAALAELISTVADGRPYYLEAPCFMQFLPINAFVRLLALSRFGRRRLANPNVQPQLPAPLRPAPQPPLGDGPMEVVECGNLLVEESCAGHIALCDYLDAHPDFAAKISLRWMNGPGENPDLSVALGAFVEILRHEATDRFWLLLREMAASKDVMMQTYHDFVGSPHAPLPPEHKRTVLREFGQLDACRIPKTWPMLVVGRRMFFGLDAHERLHAAITAGELTGSEP